MNIRKQWMFWCVIYIYVICADTVWRQVWGDTWWEGREVLRWRPLPAAAGHHEAGRGAPSWDAHVRGDVGPHPVGGLWQVKGWVEEDPPTSTDISCTMIVYLFVLYVLTTSKAISWSIPTCDNAHSSRLYTVAWLGDQASGSITQFPTQSHDPDAELTNPHPILVMQSAMLDSNKC